MIGIILLAALGVVLLFLALFSLQHAFRKLRYRQRAMPAFVLSLFLLILSACAFIGGCFVFGHIFPVKLGG